MKTRFLALHVLMWSLVLAGPTALADCRISMDFHFPSAGVVVQDLPSNWMSAYGANVAAAGKYEKRAKAQGVTPDPEVLHQLLGGTPVHLRMTTFQNGLRYVTIHTDDGTQIFDDHAYAGLTPCGCGKAHTAVSTSPKTKDVDLGDGFSLKMTLSDPKRLVSFVQKTYETDNVTHTLNYNVDPLTEYEMNNLVLLYTSQDKKTGRYVMVKLDHHKNRRQGIEIIIGYALSENGSSPARDQVTFMFGADGKLEWVRAVSESNIPNGAWSNPRVLAAIKKGQVARAEYGKMDKEGQFLVRTILFPNYNPWTSALDLNDVVDKMMAAATHNAPLDLRSLLKAPYVFANLSLGLANHK